MRFHQSADDHGIADADADAADDGGGGDDHVIEFFSCAKGSSPKAESREWLGAQPQSPVRRQPDVRFTRTTNEIGAQLSLTSPNSRHGV